jgi:hypothetical protein
VTEEGDGFWPSPFYLLGAARRLVQHVLDHGIAAACGFLVVVLFVGSFLHHDHSSDVAEGNLNARPKDH